MFESTSILEGWLAFGILHTRSLPVFLTDASTVSLSHGISVFRSMSSQDIPSYNTLYNNNNQNNIESIYFFTIYRNFKFACLCFMDSSIETRGNFLSMIWQYLCRRWYIPFQHLHKPVPWWTAELPNQPMLYHYLHESPEQYSTTHSELKISSQKESKVAYLCLG